MTMKYTQYGFIQDRDRFVAPGDPEFAQLQAKAARGEITIDPWVPPPAPTKEEQRRARYRSELADYLDAALGYEWEAAAEKDAEKKDALQKKADKAKADYLTQKAKIRAEVGVD